MRRNRRPDSWVVYRATFDRKAEGMTAVCDQDEWEAMEQTQPGRCVLLKGGISSEGEAEQLARAERTVAAKPAARPAHSISTAVETTRQPEAHSA